jgi:hypothetical protein
LKLHVGATSRRWTRLPASLRVPFAAASQLSNATGHI